MKGSTLLVLTLFVSLLMCWVFIPVLCEWVALTLMVVAGIPHGSFDLRVAEAKWRKAPFCRKKIIAAYLICVVGMAGVCVFFPFIGLCIFLLISALHFSEGESNSTSPPSLFMGAALGISAILLPIGLHTDQALVYLSYFVPETIFLSIEKPLVSVSHFTVYLLGIILLGTILTTRANGRTEIFERLLCLCAWAILPPLSGFAVWFIGRHSRQHLEACRKMFIGSRSRPGVPFDFVVVSILAIAGLLPFMLLFDFSRIEEMFAASICLIAGLTLPHMVVSHRMKEAIHPE